MAYLKPALTIGEQLEQLRRRGMAFADESCAAHDLPHKNYYRLRAYWMPFEMLDSDGEHIFRAGTTWNKVMDLYELDQKLRAVLMQAIERLEISLRTRWAHVFSLKYGPHAHEDATIFKNIGTHTWLWQKLKKNLIKILQVFKIL